jgi:hypothetical protein
LHKSPFPGGRLLVFSGDAQKSVSLLLGRVIVRIGQYQLRQRLAGINLLLFLLGGVKPNCSDSNDSDAAAPGQPDFIGFNPWPYFEKVGFRCVLQLHNETAVFRPETEKTSLKSTVATKLC